MKKILLLGGSAQQIVAIKMAKSLGYFTVLCDYLSDNPGQYCADKFYNISTTDKEAVLSVALKENIEGVLAYASDPAAPSAAYAADALNLAGNPIKSVETLCNKDKFREFLTNNGFFSPKAKGYSDILSAEHDIRSGYYKLPILVKPVDSSGSKGIARIDNCENITQKLNNAMRYSHSKKIVLEEYVHNYGYQIAGDGISIDGKLVFRCFGNDHFDKGGEYPFVPIAATFPSVLPDEVQAKIHDEIQRLIYLLGMKTCLYNFDIRVDSDFNVYLMEVAPRSGGNYIPQIIKYATGIDMVKLAVKAAMNEPIELKAEKTVGFWAYYAVHSRNSGVLKRIKIDDDVLKNNVVEQFLTKKSGDRIEKFSGANMTLGILLMKFENMESMIELVENSEKWLTIELEGE